MTFTEWMEITKKKQEVERQVRAAKAKKLREALQKIGEKQAGEKK